MSRGVSIHAGGVSGCGGCLWFSCDGVECVWWFVRVVSWWEGRLREKGGGGCWSRRCERVALGEVRVVGGVQLVC